MIHPKRPGAPALRLVLLVALAGAALVAVIAAMTGRTPDVTPASTSSSARIIGGPFTLTDHTGARVSDTDFHGQPMLVFFGFTYCPDVCPMTLQTITRALAMLEPQDAEQFQVVMISVDPERDTPEALALYLGSDGFPANLTGLTGSLEEIATVAKQYGAFYEKYETPDSYSEYLVGHSAYIYLMDSDGVFVEPFAGVTMPAARPGDTPVPAASPDDLARGLQRFLDRRQA